MHAEVVAELVRDDRELEVVVDVDDAPGHVAEPGEAAAAAGVEDEDHVVVLVQRRGADGGRGLRAPGRPVARSSRGSPRSSRGRRRRSGCCARERDRAVALFGEVVRDRVRVRDEHALQLRVGEGRRLAVAERDHDDRDGARRARGERRALVGLRAAREARFGPVTSNCATASASPSIWPCTREVGAVGRHRLAGRERDDARALRRRQDVDRARAARDRVDVRALERARSVTEASGGSASAAGAANASTASEQATRFATRGMRVLIDPGRLR